MLNALIRFGATQSEPPALFYQGDGELLLIAQHQKQLEQVFRFVVAEPALVENLVNKAKFQKLAEHLNLPVPATRRIHSSLKNVDEIDLRFPVIIKPVRERTYWEAIGGRRKALLVESPEVLRKLLPQLASVSIDLLIQEAILGPESSIESYHVYVDQLGIIVAEFTGRKIRTFPVTCGHSTALETTDAPDVRALGREIVQKLNLRGVAKMDFKRGPEGTLYLLEVNPRFNLWHHLGAVAGVNLPALVYADLLGLPRSTNLVARPGVRWSKLWSDMHAARECGTPVTTWLWWALHCEAKSGMAWDDPVPILRWALAKFRLQRGARSVRHREGALTRAPAADKS
ncbi:ATP-grasp domain-containing protein [Microvirga vignae]|nr:ATP-grasp domain-containing protein [Microvirga vignae]